MKLIIQQLIKKQIQRLKQVVWILETNYNQKEEDL